MTEQIHKGKAMSPVWEVHTAFSSDSEAMSKCCGTTTTI